MKNDLSQFMKNKKPILSENSTKPQDLRPRASRQVKKIISRKPKSEKTEHRIQAMLTQAEYNKLLESAGDVPISKYIRSALRRAGEI